MYSTVKMLHSYWAYLVLLMIVIAAFNALIKHFGKKEYEAKDFRIALFALIVTHIQLLMGLVLYFSSPKWFQQRKGEWNGRLGQSCKIVGRGASFRRNIGCCLHNDRVFQA